MSADLTSSFALELDDRISGPAGNASSALADLKDKIDADTKVLREMQTALGRLKGGTSTNTEEFKRLKAQIDAQKASIAQAQSGYLSMGGTFDGAAKKQKSFLEEASKTPGIIGQMAGKLNSLKTMLGSAGGKYLLAGAGALVFAGAVFAGVAAAVAAARAVAHLTFELVRYGVAAADARRNETLHLEGLIATARHSRLATANAGELMNAIDRVSGVAAISREEVGGYAESLARAGLHGANLRSALEGVSISAAVGGEAAGRRFMALAVGAARTGRSVRALADDVRTRLGGLNARMNLSFDRQIARLRESFAALFGGPRVAAALERFLFQVGRIQELFSQTSASGRALRTIIEAVFPSMLDGVSSAGDSVRRFFQHTIIGAQRVTIAFLSVRNAVRSAFRVGALNDTMLGLLVASTPVVVTLASVFFLLRGAISAVASQFLVAFAVLAGFFMLVGRITRFFQETDWRAEGVALIDGILEGITSGYDRVTGAISDLAAGAREAFTDALGIASPSRVFARYGLDVARGAAMGVRRGTDETEAAVGGMISVPTSSGAARAAAAPSAGSSASIAVSIDSINVYTQATNASDIADDIRAQITRIFEDLAVELAARTT